MDTARMVERVNQDRLTSQDDQDNFRTKYTDSAEGFSTLIMDDAGSTIVAGQLQVRPKGATQVAPALFSASHYRSRYPTVYSSVYSLFFQNTTPTVDIRHQACEILCLASISLNNPLSADHIVKLVIILTILCNQIEMRYFTLVQLSAVMALPPCERSLTKL